MDVLPRAVPRARRDDPAEQRGPDLPADGAHPVRDGGGASLLLRGALPGRLGGQAADEALLQRRRCGGMTSGAVTAGQEPVPTPGGSGPGSGRRGAVESSASWRLTDRIGLAFAWFLGLLFCAITVAIVAYLAVQGIRYLRPELIWTNPQVGFTQSETGGFLGPLIGTFLVAGIAIGIAGPVGVGVAVWLSEYGRPTALARVVESTVEMLAGAPSVGLGLFGILLFESTWLGFLSDTASNGVVFGKSFFACGAMLSLVALPLVVSTVREGLQAIPNHVREASYAVGKSKTATIRRVLLPAARPSVITGTMLGIGHVIGDTAIIRLLRGDN